MWITITAEDVKRRLAAAEYNSLGNAAKQVDQDPAVLVAEAIAETTMRVRGYVSGCARNVLGDGNTIPDELKSAALALIRDYLFTRLPGMKSLNDDLRQREVERAMTELRDTAACKLAIVGPATPAEEQAGGPAFQLIHARKKIATRRDLDGLM